MNATVDIPVPANRALGDDCSVTEAGPNFSAHPAYFRERQQAAWEQFKKLPMPARTDEGWRFSDLKALDLAPFKRAPLVTDDDRAALLERSLGLAETSGRIVFANDGLLAQEFHGFGFVAWFTWVVSWDYHFNFDGDDIPFGLN